MAEPFLGQITIVGFNFAPRGYAFCDGQILPINQNQALYSILGTTYGGDGRTTFALPDLRGRTPIHEGDGYQLGQSSGLEMVALDATEIPSHTHAYQVSQNAPTAEEPNGLVLGKPAPNLHYADGSNADRVAMHTDAIGKAGGGQGHNNMQPFLTINYCIALQGVFPPRN